MSLFKVGLLAMAILIAPHLNEWGALLLSMAYVAIGIFFTHDEARGGNG